MRILPLLFIALLASARVHAGVVIQHWIAPSGAKVYFVETRVVPILDVQIDFLGASGLPCDLGLGFDLRLTDAYRVRFW